MAIGHSELTPGTVPRERRGETSISIAIAAFQAERWVAEAIDSVLAQTRPPDEVIVVDDGSMDETPRILEAYGDRIRVIRQENRGASAAFNRGFREATGDFVALCAADDVWEPRKLEWQAEAIAAHPEVDVLFGHAKRFGAVEGDYARPPAGMTGLLDSDELREALFVTNFVSAPSALIRRSLYERLGPFAEDLPVEDYEYWLRCLRAGARFYYDPRSLLGWRQHGDNLSGDRAGMQEYATGVRLQYAADIADRAMVRRILAQDLFRVGRNMVDEGRPGEARQAFLRSLRYVGGVPVSASARALVWGVALSLPARPRARLCAWLVRASRTADDMRGGRDPALP